MMVATITLALGVITTAAFAAANLAIGIMDHSSLNIGAGIFCSFMFVISLTSLIRLGSE